MTALLLLSLLLLLLAAVWTVLEPELLRGAITLGVTSVVLTLIMFQLAAPLAAVFELSVCAGLITVVFVSAISLTRLLSPSEERVRQQERWRRFIWLPVLLAITAIIFYLEVPIPEQSALVLPAQTADVRMVLWSQRRFDLVGQVLIILAGVFGVVVLFKETFRLKR